MRHLRGAARALLSVAALASTLASANRSWSFCRTTTNASFVPTAERPCDEVGRPLSWSSSCVGFRVQRSASVQVDLPTAEALLERAFATWSAQPCTSTLGATCGGPTAGQPTITARNLGPVECGEVGWVKNGSNANVLVFRDGDWPHDGVAIALTTITYAVDSGTLRDADIEVQSNPEQVKLAAGEPVAPDAYDLQSILAHETGHFLGLAHTQPANRTATMFSGYAAGSTSMRAPSADDACGICNVYPPTRVAACEPLAAGGATTCGGGDESPEGCGCSIPGARRGGGAPAALVLSLAWLMYLRRDGAARPLRG